MKLTTKIVEVPAEPASTYEEQTWTCEIPGCDFGETNDKEHADAHYAKEHSFKAKKSAGGYTFLWFENAEDYRAYHQDWEGSYGDLGYDGEYFVGPGWYGLKSVSIPCRCGSCGNYATYGTAASTFSDELTDKISKLTAEADEIVQLMKSKP
jgi:hypothetical protein